MRFYVGSSFQNKALVNKVASKLQLQGWQQTYDWTQNERANTIDDLKQIGIQETVAIENADSYIERFYNFFQKEVCEPSHLSLFKPHTRNINQFVLEQDILYVGGGNTKNLMALWKEWELDEAIRQAYNNGTILSGISAGSLCWFEGGVTDSYGNELEPISCLSLIQGSHCPHYDGEEERRPAYQKLIQENLIGAGYAADDGVALHFVEGKLLSVVSSRPKASGYYVDKEKETKLSTKYLGNR